MSQVDFFVIGAMKCGTSTVCGSFEEHPEVHMPRGAERNFFSYDEVYAKGFDWYHETMAGRDGQRLTGEGCNSYAVVDRYPETPARLAAYNPDARIIFMVRNPVDRLISEWIQKVAQGSDQRNVNPDTLVEEKDGIYFMRSRYWSTISAYRDHFPDERIFLGFVEDMQADPDPFFAGICRFLGVADDRPLSTNFENRSVGKAIPSPLSMKLRKNPMVRAAAKFAPTAAKDFVRQRLLGKEVKAPPKFSPEARAKAADLLREDTEALLTWAGKPLDYWRL